MIMVEAEVLNEFKLIQRLFMLGTDFDIISPYSLKRQVISKLKTIKQGYKL
jgi:predicted DNA-binding transcriptional regulator YafY